MAPWVMQRLRETVAAAESPGDASSSCSCRRLELAAALQQPSLLLQEGSL
jgi:hypothetical protein